MGVRIHLVPYLIYLIINFLFITIFFGHTIFWVERRCISIFSGTSLFVTVTGSSASHTFSQYRYHNLRSMRWCRQGNRQYRRPCSDQADTCPPGEKSGIKRIQLITREQGTAPNRFVRVADEISLTQSTHQIAASKSSGR